MKEKRFLEGKPEEETRESIGTGGTSYLILHNDEIHSFEYVIESLIEVCDHDEVQAEQCTMIVHYKGQCDVRVGDAQSLLPMQEGLVSRGLIASIE
jgi:ATP-dependent Clp protease adaptor protein ClpS